MKKIIIALCSAMIVLSCGLLTPISASAEDRACNHQPEAHLVITQRQLYSHTEYLIVGGVVVDSWPCVVYQKYSHIEYRCSLCNVKMGETEEEPYGSPFHVRAY